MADWVGIRVLLLLLLLLLLLVLLMIAGVARRKRSSKTTDPNPQEQMATNGIKWQQMAIRRNEWQSPGMKE